MSRAIRASLILSLISSCLPLCTQAHMQMSWPYPLRSPLDPDVPTELKDYDYTNPLAANGDDFPCKHYQDTETNPQAYNIKAVYQAGSKYNMSLAGTATHDGGSCQISLSYDNGATFKVIQSIIGGCPLTPSYNFTIPSFAPSSDAVLLSWSWLNLVGNREMYQNCARVSIKNQIQPNHRYRRAVNKRQASLHGLPDMFACNIGNGCTTIERQEVVFPDPGPNVVYGRDEITPDPGPGFTLSSTFASSSASNASPTSTTSQSSPSPSFLIATTTTALSRTSTSYIDVASTDLTTSSFYGSYVSSSTFTTSTLTTSMAMSIATISTATTSTVPTSTVPTSTDPASMFTTSTFTTAPFPRSSFSIGTLSNTLLSSRFFSSTMYSLPDASAMTKSPSVISVTVAVTATPPPALVTTNQAVSTSSHIQSTSVITTTRPITGAVTSSSFTTRPVFSSSISGVPMAPSASNLPCTPRTFACNSPNSFSQCVSNGAGSASYIYMGSVAAGMQCSNGQITRQNAGPCTLNGQIYCNGSNAFYICDQGGLISMGPVAGGTQCVDGNIVAAQS